MPDAGPPVPEESPSRQPARRAAKRGPSGMFRDPVVRGMSYAAVGIVILFLVTVISALLTGVLAPSGPRTLAEREAAVAGAAVRAGSADTAVWGQYISSLIAQGQYARAKSVIADGRASIEDSATAEFTLAEARLYSAQGQYEQAVEMADVAMAQMKDYHETLLASGGSTARAAKLDGLPDNYYSALLVKAYALRDLGRYEDAVEVFDLYIEDNPTAADILIDRGMARIETGDTTGAEEDFRSALQFLPDSPEALAGLERIGVTP